MRPGKSIRPQLRSTAFRDRYNVAGNVVGDVCFACECRILELGGDDGMLLAWCECGWPEDAAVMEVLSVTSLSR